MPPGPRYRALRHRTNGSPAAAGEPGWFQSQWRRSGAATGSARTAHPSPLIVPSASPGLALPLGKSQPASTPSASRTHRSLPQSRTQTLRSMNWRILSRYSACSSSVYFSGSARNWLTCQGSGPTQNPHSSSATRNCCTRTSPDLKPNSFGGGIGDDHHGPAIASAQSGLGLRSALGALKALQAPPYLRLDH